MPTRKISVDDDFLNTIRKVNEPKIENKNPIIDKGNSSVKKLFNFKISETMYNNLKYYCEQRDMTMTAGVKRAIREMLERVE